MEQQINFIQKQLKNYPEGKIFCTRNGSLFKWYHSDGKKQTYIPKKNRTFAEQLTAKKYLLFLLEDLKQERRALDFYLRHHTAFPGKAENMFLYTHQIPFRYECALYLGESVIFPDFTIRHPHTGETYYWEHFGLADDPRYCKSVCTKLQLYMSNGIIPSIHLITTYETKEHPLSSETVNKMIQDYFL